MVSDLELCHHETTASQEDDQALPSTPDRHHPARQVCDECKADRLREEEVRRNRPPRERRARWRRLTREDEQTLRHAKPETRPELVESLQRDGVGSRRIAAVLGLSPQKKSSLYPRSERST